VLTGPSREYKPDTATVTQQSVLATDPPSNAVTAYPGMSASLPMILNVRASLNFVVPSVCLFCCIPIGYAYFYGSPTHGTATDSDFWQLVAGSAMQLLSIVTLFLPSNVQGKLPHLSGIYSGLLLIASGITLPASIVLYLFVSARWSIVVSYIGNAAQVLILLQLTNAL
jgi:hypothetical protein